MQSNYLHLVYGPCVEARGRLLPGPQPSGSSVDYVSDGVVLLQSSGASALRDYEVYHSRGEYFMGILCRHWHRLGLVGEYYQNSLRNPNPMDVREIMGQSFTEVFLCSNPRGTVDAFFRGRWDRPLSVFAHYELRVRDPSVWWEAQSYIFHGRVTLELA